MAKRKKSAIAKYGKFVLVFISIVVVAMAFLPAVKYTNGDTVYTGWEVAFGKTLSNVSFGSTTLGNATIDFSILAVIAIFLSFVGSVVFGFVISNRQIAGLFVFICFAGAAVLFFLMPQITKVTTEVAILGSSTSTFADLKYGLGIGSILGGAFSCVGSLASLGYAMIK